MSWILNLVQQEHTMNLALNLEDVEAVWDELQDVMQDNADEVEEMPVSLDVNKDMYFKMQEIGALLLYILRDRGTIVGYFSVLVQPSLHYKTKTQAYFDVMYIKPEYRNKATMRILKAIESNLALKGVDFIMCNMKAARPAKRLMRLLGFTHIEDVFCKVLGDR